MLPPVSTTTSDLARSWTSSDGGGIEPAYDWTRSEEFNNVGAPHPGASDEVLPDAECKRYATLDIEGVKGADILILLADLDGYTGSYIEFGAAVATGTKVIVVAPAKRSIFWYLDGVAIVDTQEEALELVFALAAAQG